MKMKIKNTMYSSLHGLIRSTTTTLALVALTSLASAQMPGFSSDDDWVGTLPSIHVGPEDAQRTGVDQGVSAFYIEGPWRQVLDAAMRAGGGYVSVEVISNEEFRAVFHGDHFLAFDLEHFEENDIRCGMRTETGAGVVALQVGHRLVRSQQLSSDLRIPVKRLNRLGFLDSGVILHAVDSLGGRSRTSMRTIGGRLYLFQTS